MQALESSYVVLEAMGYLEREHGGPRYIHAEQAWAALTEVYSLATVRKALRRLHASGEVEIAGRTTNSIDWRLTERGRRHPSVARTLEHTDG